MEGKYEIVGKATDDRVHHYRVSGRAEERIFWFLISFWGIAANNKECALVFNFKKNTQANMSIS